jgi:hypothetical protein
MNRLDQVFLNAREADVAAAFGLAALIPTLTDAHDYDIGLFCYFDRFGEAGF